MRILSFVACLALALLLFACPARAEENVRPDGKPAFANLDVPQFEKLRANTNHVVLDVRTQAEFDLAHIPGAVNLDVNGPDFEKAAGKLDRSKVYLVHCASGIRSMKACNIMRPLGFTNLNNLQGGFRAWDKAQRAGKK
ncbi:MAG: rhodanese-like domain-containing protein [Verrucomicrobiota bacterium]